MSETRPPADPFEALLKRYYGGHHHHRRHHGNPVPYGHGRHLGDGYRAAQVDERADRLLAGYYGRHRHRHHGRTDWKAPAAVSVSMDDGETLQPLTGEEYVVAATLEDTTFEEYVVDRPGISGEASLSAARTDDVNPRDECRLDIANPLGAAKPTDCACHAAAPAEVQPRTPQATAPAGAMASGVQLPVSAPPVPELDAPPPSDDDFISDMQAILSRQKVFDPVTKKTVAPDKLAKPATVDPPPAQEEPANNSQAIFDKIAQSMQYANKYDLGTVELENRFADFDRISDLEQQAAARKRTAPAPTPERPAAEMATAVDSQDFIQDLDAMRRPVSALSIQGSDADSDPFAFLPPAQDDAAGSGAIPDGSAAAGAASGALPGMPLAAMPSIQLPNIPMPAIQMPGMPTSSSLSASTFTEPIAATAQSNLSLQQDPAPAVSPFPAPFADPLTADDQKLTDAFNAALAAVKGDHDYAELPSVDDLPIILVALNSDKTRPSVGRHSSNMFYAGSMLKIAAMYAAFQLRQAVNQLAATLDPAKVTNAAGVFAAIRKTFDAQILKAPDLIRNESTAGNRAPQYERIFAAKQDTGVWSVEFRADPDPKLNFAGHLRRMVVDSHNPSAGFCIQALGFSWIDGLMQKAGLFKPATKRGLWLAGDYLLPAFATKAAHDAPDGDPEGKEEFDLGISGWREVRIPSDNDGPSKQATTCIDAARLLVLLVDAKLVAPAIANGEMRGLLTDAVSGGAPSIVARVPTSFTVLQSKIGFGTLGNWGNCTPDKNTGRTKGCVQSEAMVVRQAAAPHHEFVVVYQNVKDAANQNLKQIARVRDIIQQTMDGYH